MHPRDVVVLGASAGGVDALIRVARGLPPDLAAAVVVVVHVAAHAESRLPAILARSGPLPAEAVVDSSRLQPGRIFVASPDHHLVVDRGHVRAVMGPRENLHRPSIDVTMRSAAAAYADRTIGVVLSGALDDGVAGLRAIVRQGGIALVQDPDDALVPDMPRAAYEAVEVEACLTSDEIGPAIARLVARPMRVDVRPAASGELEEVAVSDVRNDLSHEPQGRSSVFACPACGGVLWELEDGDSLRYRCRVGHAFSSEALDAAQTDGLEDALWSALRALEENAALARRLARRSSGLGRIASHYEGRAETAERQAEAIRLVLAAEPGRREEAV